MKSVLSQRKTIDLYLFLGLVLIAILITILYISQEQYIYFWDYTHYSDRVSELATKLQRSPLKAIECFIDYLGDDYTQIPSLLLLPFALLLGNSRLVFILSLVLVYIVSFCLIVGKITTKIIQHNTRFMFWISAFLTLLTPATWESILRGYPDLGGASLMGLAVLFYWKHPQLNQRKHIMQLAGLLAIAVWFRRPFAYSVRAFLIAILIESLWKYINNLKQSPKISFKDLKQCLFKLLKVGTWFIIFSPVLVFKVLFVDYRSLYASYELTAYEGFKYYTAEFGWIICFLGFLGYTIGAVAIPSLQFQRYRFFWILGILSIAQWIFWAKQNGSHYTTHFIPFIVVGLMLFIVSVQTSLQNKRKWRIVLVILGSGLTVLNLFSGLTNIVNSSALSVLFPTSQPPLYRADYDEFSRLIQFLRNNTSENQAIYVAASSQTLTSDAILAGDRQIFHNSQLKVLRTSNIDSRDVYPLNALMKASWVVVASPVQYHLKPNEQNVVKVVVDAFQQNWLFSEDFERMPTKFTLQQGVQVNIYRRIRETSLPTVLATLQQMRTNIDRQPGREPYWLALQSEQSSNIEKDIIRTVQIRDIPLQQGHTSSFLYFGTLPSPFSLKGKLNTRKCTQPRDFSLQVSSLNSQGDILTTQSWHGSQEAEISIGFQPLPAAAYLRLSIQPLSNVSVEQSKNECSISINNIVVSEVH